MVTAILIAFEYKSLPGAIVDLYNVYKWCEKFTHDIQVVTDIKENKHHKVFNNIDVSDENLYSFYDRIQNLTVVKNADDLLSFIKYIKVPDNKLILYYSGHGVKNEDCFLVLPDQSLISFDMFKQKILSNLHIQCEIFCILDCCNPNGMNLPFKLNNNEFNLSKKNIQPITQLMLLITSSEEDEKSIATFKGSIFTQQLFKLLNEIDENYIPERVHKRIYIPSKNNRNLNRLLERLTSRICKIDTGYKQTVSVYCSYNIPPVLWMWIGSKKDYDLIIDSTHNMFMIRKYPISVNPYDLSID